MILTDRAAAPERFLVDHFTVDNLVHESVMEHSSRHSLMVRDLPPPALRRDASFNTFKMQVSRKRSRPVSARGEFRHRVSARRVDVAAMRSALVPESIVYGPPVPLEQVFE